MGRRDGSWPGRPRTREEGKAAEEIGGGIVCTLRNYPCVTVVGSSSKHCFFFPPSSGHFDLIRSDLIEAICEGMGCWVAGLWHCAGCCCCFLFSAAVVSSPVSVWPPVRVGGFILCSTWSCRRSLAAVIGIVLVMTVAVGVASMFWLRWGTSKCFIHGAFNNSTLLDDDRFFSAFSAIDTISTTEMTFSKTRASCECRVAH